MTLTLEERIARLESLIGLDGKVYDAIPDRVVSLALKHTAQFFELNTSAILCRIRTKRLIWPRHIAMTVTRELSDLSLKEIAQQFGRKDHSTIINAIKHMKKAPDIRHEQFNAIRARVVAELKAESNGTH